MFVRPDPASGGCCLYTRVCKNFSSSQTAEMNSFVSRCLMHLAGEQRRDCARESDNPIKPADKTALTSCGDGIIPTTRASTDLTVTELMDQCFSCSSVEEEGSAQGTWAHNSDPPQQRHRTVFISVIVYRCRSAHKMSKYSWWKLRPLKTSFNQI